MTKQYATVEVRKMRGNLVLVGLARTARGQRYIKAQVPIGCTSMTSKDFKTKLAAAMAELTGEALPAPQ